MNILLSVKFFKISVTSSIVLFSVDRKVAFFRIFFFARAFFALSIFIYIGAFEVAKKFFGDGDTALFIGAVCGGICFWWMVSKIKD